ncbi:MAG: trypsin-like peptidase domain-containing protein [Acidimicrobiia bacterium]|nr:trypsin-like peptidase domain-containing protein [Acidimicrobiia bacterium]
MEPRATEPMPSGLPETPVHNEPNRNQNNERRGYWRWYAAAAVVAAAVAGGISAAATSDSSSVVADDEPVATTTTTVVEAPSVAPATATDTTVIEAPLAIPSPAPLLLDASAVGEAVIPSVVTVQITGTAFNGQEAVLGSGSGVVYDNNGHILTNDHVVAAGSNYEIVLADGRIYPAEIVGTDPSTDLAVLEVTALDLQPIAIGSTDALTVGDPAVAVGSPLGLDGGPSLTVGVISAFGRQVQTSATSILYGMLQTDAPITSGSSGGALVDSAGRLVGITTAVGVSDVGVEGIGFATPSEIVTRVADEIIATGSASSPYLGIWPEPALEDTADGGSEPQGILVTQVDAGTAAAAAGINEGDVIAAIDGIRIDTFNDLVAALRRFGAGDTIRMTLDDGTIIPVILGDRPEGL